MEMSNKNLLIIPMLVFCSALIVNSRHIPEGYYHSDVIVTKWPTTPALEVLGSKVKGTEVDSDQRQSGWVRQQLLKFGQVASKIGNAMGKHTSKIAVALDKVCEVIKTVLPLLAAVCHVGEFQFCAATDDVPVKLSEALNVDTLDLNVLDR